MMLWPKESKVGRNKHMSSVPRDVWMLLAYINLKHSGFRGFALGKFELINLPFSVVTE